MNSTQYKSKGVYAINLSVGEQRRPVESFYGVRGKWEKGAFDEIIMNQKSPNNCVIASGEPFRFGTQGHLSHLPSSYGGSTSATNHRFLRQTFL